MHSLRACPRIRISPEQVGVAFYDSWRYRTLAHSMRYCARSPFIAADVPPPRQVLATPHAIASARSWALLFGVIDGRESTLGRIVRRHKPGPKEMRLLRDSGSPWIIIHGLAPFALVLLSGCHSYGLWQKCLILYLVALANLRHHRLCRMSESEPVSESTSELFGGGGVNGRRTVYRLEAGPEWARLKTR